MVAMWLVFLLLVPVVHAEDWTVKADTGCIAIKRGTLDEIVQDLRLRCGLKIAYIQSSDDLTSKKTINDFLDSLLSIPEKDRTRIEKERIEAFQGLIKQDANRATQFIPYPETHDFILPTPPAVIANPDQVNDVLTQLTSTFPKYSWVRSNTLILIYSKSDVLNATHVDFELDNASVTEAFSKLEPLLEQNKIARRLSSKVKYDNATHINLHLHNVTMIELLCRFSECLGPTFTFGMGGSPPETGWRTMGFSALEPPNAADLQMWKWLDQQ